ncbi:MAG TPA: hypothetical protein VNK96_06795 [Fimbriimonadales bacterium]|nr:hypothetical protein [Fimbriimonadales bacterium]
MPKRLTEIAEKLRSEIAEQHEARETALAEARKIIQLSAKTIKHVHRGNFEDAKKLLEEAETRARRVAKTLAKYPGILYAPYFQDSLKEYAEAALFTSIVQNQPLPTPLALGVLPQAYLNGLSEAASECRRYALDVLRRGDPEEAKRLADDMEDIYDELVTFDYPDALMANLRRNVDALRAVLERTQSDLAVTSMQLELIQELKKQNRTK